MERKGLRSTSAKATQYGIVDSSTMESETSGKCSLEGSYVPVDNSRRTLKCSWRRVDTDLFTEALADWILGIADLQTITR